MSTESAAAVNGAQVNGNGARRRGLIILGVVVAVGIVAYATYWLFFARYYQSTDDAYVASDIVQITSKIPGTVLSVYVDDTQTIERGQSLVDLDPADARIAMSSAEANLASVVRQVRGLYSQADQLRSQIAERTTELKQAQDDFKRRETLVEDGAVSGEELAHARDAIARVRSTLEGAQQQLDTTLAKIDGTTVATHPDVLAAAAKYHDAALSLRRAAIAAPLTGVVAKRGVQVGQRVAAGAPLMAIVALDNVWIEANFKEGQLRDVRVGQPVRLEADLYGSQAEYRGTVAGLSAGSGSAFALLPSQNASGNWIKVVQRLPVRIALNSEDVKKHPLRVGLSMKARIDVHDTSGALVATKVRATPQPAQQSDGDDPAIDARVAEIIRLNSEKPSAVAANRSTSSRRLVAKDALAARNSGTVPNNGAAAQ